jgi:hypothetical protein
VRVPLDYGRPHGPKISLAVSQVRHTSSDADYQGVMLVNPGGPGGSGLPYSVLGQFVPYYVPVNRRIERAWLARSKSYAAACDENAGRCCPT